MPCIPPRIGTSSFGSQESPQSYVEAAGRQLVSTLPFFLIILLYCWKWQGTSLKQINISQTPFQGGGGRLLGWRGSSSGEIKDPD